LSSRDQLGVLKVEEGSVESVAFAPDGRTLAAGYGRNGVQGGVVLWDGARHARLGPPLPVDEGEVKSVAFAPDGKTIAAACAGGGIVLWDAARRERTGKLLDSGDGQGSAWCVAFSPDGQTIAVGDRGLQPRGVQLWDLAYGQPVGTPLLLGDGSVASVAFAADGQKLAAITPIANGDVILWDVDPESWARRAAGIANRNLSLSEWRRYLGPDVPYHRTIPALPDGAGVEQTGKEPATSR
jgi:WD40 repeat protein